jgi:hypothetical protein
MTHTPQNLLSKSGLNRMKPSTTPVRGGLCRVFLWADEYDHRTTYLVSSINAFGNPMIINFYFNSTIVNGYY